jgi:N-acetylmuramoyl-L-alanine amidase
MRRTVSNRGLNVKRRIRVGRLAVLVGACVVAAVLPAQASAHTVTSGETLSYVAAANGLTTEDLAAANGLSPDALLIAGESLYVPYPSGSGGGGSGGGGEASSGGGSYVVQPGDTLSGIAASAGLSIDELAHLNGLYVDNPLIAGTTLTTSGSGGGSANTASTGAAPVPTNETVSPGQVGDIAASENVSPSLADAVATQESGFDNSLVSSADARGVMQILPSTWDFINGSLASAPLDPASARDNVRAGALYLGYLADNTGNDPVSTVASYYQGLGSVQSGGLLPETEQYVDSVLALRDRYRGG